MTVQTTTGPLPEVERIEVVRLAEAAEVVDGVPALSDSVLLGSESEMTHLIVRVNQRLIGYAAVEPYERVIEIVVAPQHRGEGIGAELLASAIAAGGRQMWTRGSRRTPHQLALQAGMRPQRHLWCMSRPISADDHFEARVPPPFHLRSLETEADVLGLLAVNAAAFTELVDQGSWGLEDVAARQSAPWYDPEDVILLEQVSDIVGFHWTKVYPDKVTGEVYVLALDPRVQGIGLAGPLLDRGLLHLARRGCRRVLLYVDEGNESARRLYSTHGFIDERLDILYRCAG